MPDDSVLEDNLQNVLDQFQTTFNEKKRKTKKNELHDLLMDVFSLTPKIKRQNRQYWGRELGKCWLSLMTHIFKQTRDDFQPAVRFGTDEICDFVVANYAIYTRYRIGSGDSITLKKFKVYGPLLRKQELEPTLLILRTDNLHVAMRACEMGNWNIYKGVETLNFIQEMTGFDLEFFLQQHRDKYSIDWD